jgi:hypothetical protein
LRNPAIGGFDVQTLIDAPSGTLMRGLTQLCTTASLADLLLVYLSCHGLLDDRGRLYYATINTERPLLAATALSSQWLNEQLDDCRARRRILLLDCCHSGAFAKGAKGEDTLALKDRFAGRGKVVLTASRATEYSFEGNSIVGDGVRSVFTRAVVEGLRTGDADQDGDGLITVIDLYRHVYDTVRASRHKQTPELWMEGGEGDLLVGYSPRGAVINQGRTPEDSRRRRSWSAVLVKKSRKMRTFEIRLTKEVHTVTYIDHALWQELILDGKARAGKWNSWNERENAVCNFTLSDGNQEYDAVLTDLSEGFVGDVASGALTVLSLSLYRHFGQIKLVVDGEVLYPQA